MTRLASSVGSVVLAASAGLAMASLAGALLAFLIHVTSNSMAPWVRAGDYGVAIYAHHVDRGDVIAFRFPFGSGDLAIKRAVALAGDCVPGPADGPAAPPPGPCPTVPPGGVYVVGDNVGNSLDSRHFGAVPAGEVVGKVVLRLPVPRWLARWSEPTGRR